jgi:hypothetical protein
MLLSRTHLPHLAAYAGRSLLLNIGRSILHRAVASAAVEGPGQGSGSSGDGSSASSDDSGTAAGHDDAGPGHGAGRVRVRNTKLLPFDLDQGQALNAFARHQRTALYALHAHDVLKPGQHTLTPRFLPFQLFEAVISVSAIATLGVRADRHDKLSCCACVCVWVVPSGA